ncbi:unnamed protein product [Moneuplotes crassus]|uniref:Uncharacterized protein n=1 Tax=Euplotes crassus TaxID=5936 RepID=A0AAD2CXJ7_EUPCR|nr:unnamed protein product [Moneuplotes crassus]
MKVEPNPKSYSNNTDLIEICNGRRIGHPHKRMLKEYEEKFRTRYQDFFEKYKQNWVQYTINKIMGKDLGDKYPKLLDQELHKKRTILLPKNSRKPCTKLRSKALRKSATVDGIKHQKTGESLMSKASKNKRRSSLDISKLKRKISSQLKSRNRIRLPISGTYFPCISTHFSKFHNKESANWKTNSKLFKMDIMGEP